MSAVRLVLVVVGTATYAGLAILGWGEFAAQAMRCAISSHQRSLAYGCNA